MLELLRKARLFRKRQEEQTKATRLILEKNLTGEEIADYVNLYDEWVEINNGEYIAELTYLRHKGQLYQCAKGMGHDKEESLDPSSATDLFTKVTPEGVIPEWDIGVTYDTGDKVSHNDIVWECTADKVQGEPGVDKNWKESRV